MGVWFLDSCMSTRPVIGGISIWSFDSSFRSSSVTGMAWYELAFRLSFDARTDWVVSVFTSWMRPLSASTVERNRADPWWAFEIAKVAPD